MSCVKEKPLDEFYRHKKMADGRLNRCKECHKAAMRERYNERVKDKEWLEAERERNRKRMRESYSPEKQRERRERLGEQYRARNIVARSVRDGLIEKPEKCERCGPTEDRIEAHHTDYSKPLEVMWLCSRCHGVEERLYA